MRIVLIAVAACWWLTIAQPCHASTILGAGTQSCGTWLADRRANNWRAYMDEGWVLGWLSGVAEAGAGNPLAGVDANGVWAWVDNYCRDHPFSKIEDACAELANARHQ